MNSVGIGLNVWNGEKTIKRVLQSLLNQTYKDFKIYILDNQSTDKTIRIIKGLKNIYKKKIILKISKKKTDIPTAQRFLAKKYLAKHKYSLLANDDDFYKKDYITKLLNEIKKKKADLVFSNLNLIKSDNQIIASKIKFIRPTHYRFINVIKFLFIRTSYPLCFGIFKTKSLLKSVEHNKPIGNSKSNYDTLFMLNFLSKNQVIFLDKKIFSYAIKERLVIEKNKGGYKVLYNEVNSLYKIYYIQFLLSVKFIKSLIKEKNFSKLKIVILSVITTFVFFQKCTSYQIKFLIRKIKDLTN